MFECPRLDILKICKCFILPEPSCATYPDTAADQSNVRDIFPPFSPATSVV